MGGHRKDISAVLKRIGYTPVQTMFARRFN